MALYLRGIQAHRTLNDKAPDGGFREPEIEKGHQSAAFINSLPLPGVVTLMPLRRCRSIAADNRCASGVRAALPELILIYEPLPITTQARHYATRGSIMTAALPFGCGLSVWLSYILALQKRQSPTVLTAGLVTKAVTHRWDKINTDSGKVNSLRLKRKPFS